MVFEGHIETTKRTKLILVTGGFDMADEHRLLNHRIIHKIITSPV